MIRVQLDESEAAALCETLESFISDLRMEIADTDSLDFRNQLRQRKEVLQGVLQRLEQGRPTETAGAQP